jgi:hypothetical protein
MKKALVLLAVAAALMILTAVTVTADSANAAMVVKNDGGCSWYYGDLNASGRIQYVETKDGKWTLSCKGEATSGGSIMKALHVKSTSAAPEGFCWVNFTEYGDTTDWELIFTPSGKSSFVCHGDLAP